MATSDLAELIEQHKTAIAVEANDKARKAGFDLYVGIPEAEAIVLTENTLNLIIDYIRTGQIEVWRGYIIAATKQLEALGFTVDQINGGGAKIIETIAEEVERGFAGPENEKTRVRFLRRLDGLKTLAIVNAVGAKYDNRPETK